MALCPKLDHNYCRVEGALFLLSPNFQYRKGLKFARNNINTIVAIVLQLKPIPKFIHFNHRIQGLKVEKADGSQGVCHTSFALLA